MGKIQDKLIGKMNIHDAFNLVDVPQTLAASVIEVMSRCQIKGHPVFIKPDKGGKKRDHVVQ